MATTDYDFLPPGLQLRNPEKGEREPRWVRAEMQPEGLPPLELLVHYRTADEVSEHGTGAKLSNMQHLDFIAGNDRKKGVVTDWRNATLRNIRAIYRGEKVFAGDDSPEGRELESGKGLKFDPRLFKEVYSHSYRVALYNPIMVELTSWEDDVNREAAEETKGKGASSET